MLKRAKDAGIEKVFLPNIDQTSVDVMHDLEDNSNGYCVSMMGLHPCSVKEDYKDVLAGLKGWLDKRRYAAIGEIGIDLYWDKTFLGQQQEASRTQVRWAKDLALPIVIHCRESFNEVFSIVEDENDSSLRGVFHCFTGTPEQARMVIGLGGLAGVLVIAGAAFALTRDDSGDEKPADVVGGGAPATPACHRSTTC